ncbi:MAG: hypothetical protein HOG49_36545 [Candidatus Scalindua sp.]|jgi:hypothetical protein|nr:hypothetical protein [Candidatus Scalindua sp.]
MKYSPGDKVWCRIYEYTCPDTDKFYEGTAKVCYELSNQDSCTVLIPKAMNPVDSLGRQLSCRRWVAYKENIKLI